MSTVVLDAYSKEYPAITNRLRASVFLESDPIALVATIIENAPHPQRVWHFPGLPRANYGFSLDEIDGGGSVIQNLALFSVVPSAIDGLLTRNDEQYAVDATPGFVSGTQSFTFDGTGGKPNFIGWDIVPSELNGRGILVRGYDYSWDSITGQMVWLLPGDILQPGTWYNFRFQPRQQTAGGSVPTVIDFSSRIVEVTGNIELTDFGNNVIIEPSGVYVELTLPDITTVPQGRIVRIEMKPALGSSVQCARILPFGADIINFLSGNLFMMNNESIELYRLKRPDDSNEWRVKTPFGNFDKVGQSVSDDFTQTGVYCKQLLDGSSKDRYQYARIYEEVVLKLPATQVCDYDDWATGNNKYLFSKANSTDPGNADKFKFPDRRGLFERNNNSGKAGDYADDKIKAHTHQVKPPGANNQNGWGLTTTGITPLGGDGPITPYNTEPNGVETETQPKNYLINKYVLI